MKTSMNYRGVIFSVLGSSLFLTALFAQSAGQPELPNAPSHAAQQPKPQPAATPAQQAPPATSRGTAQDLSQPAITTPPTTDPTPNSVPQTQNSAPQTSAPPAGTAPEPQAESSPDDTTTVIRRTVNEVNVVFTVIDRHGHYVKDLKKEDFQVIDDNRPAVEIRSFTRQTDLPLQVGLLVDASNSVRDRFKFEQESAIEFLNQTIRPRYDQAFVIGFDVTPEVTQEFTDNTEKLSIGVRALQPGGGTAMYDALYFACRDRLMKAEHAGPIRRAIILLSDGDDNQSHVTREEAIEMAQRAEVIVYTISTNISGSIQRGDKVLERIAEATGGRSFEPFQLHDVANAFSEIQDELRSQYALSYKPADFRTDGRFHTIEILAQTHKNLKVRSRHGYYAPTQ
jgi:Ca-activated chloride channel family protein